MSYAMRNTLLLLSVLLVTSAVGGYLVFYELRNEVRDLKITSENKRHELAQLRSENLLFDELEKQLIDIKKVWKKVPRRIYSQENSAISFAYFNRLSGGSRNGFEYNYTLSGTTEEENLRVSDYVLVGEAGFRSLYAFIWKLEHYPVLYRINNLEIRPVSSDDLNRNINFHRINFVLEISAFSTPQDGLEPHESLAIKVMERASHNPFFPLIRENIPENTEGLFEVNGAQLIGIAGNSAFVRDRAGRTWTLKAGDKVYLGSLVRIDSTGNVVMFTLNEGGIIKNIRLEMFSKDNKRK